MKITTVLFDLDGTLLPMDQDLFIKAYFGGITEKCAAHGYDAEVLYQTMWKGIGAMIKNDGSNTNEGAFWRIFCEMYGDGAINDAAIFNDFYENEFANVKNVCGFNEKAAITVRKIHCLGLRTALATNPVFPAIATESRIKWAGLEPSDFELYTTYENSRYCKPNPKYYEEILEKLGVTAKETLMVGNDVGEDMLAAGSLGMKTFLITECLINVKNADISQFKQGGFDDLYEYIREISSCFAD